MPVVRYDLVLNAVCGCEILVKFRQAIQEFCHFPYLSQKRRLKVSYTRHILGPITSTRSDLVIKF